MLNGIFTPFPILTTERLTLRQLSIDDQQKIFELRSDKEINKYLDRQTSKTIEDAINFINKVNDNIKKSNSIYWVITLTRTRTFVGTICLFDFSNEKRSCEIGYELMPKYQRRGIMKEAAEKVIGYAFQTLQFQKIIAFTHKGNENSTKLLTKLNFMKSIEKVKENPDLNMFTLIYSSAHKILNQIPNIQNQR
ncbi:MAG TPA: GNAT family N-acetyltransferase [Flavitalea sp.]|nr:GNAT family N-acetyltransferase [Flavitalea sp.]